MVRTVFRVPKCSSRVGLCINRSSKNTISLVFGICCITAIINLAHVFGALVKPKGILQNWYDWSRAEKDNFS